MAERTYRYAGLGRVHEPGLSVAEVAERLQRFAYAEERLMRLLASRVVSVPDRDLKVLLARLQYEASLHADAWRGRVRELRTNKNKLERPPDPALEILFDEAEHLPGVFPFLAAVARVLKPALAAAYRAHEAATNGLADYPSVRLLRQHLADEEAHRELLALALADLAARPPTRTATWQPRGRRRSPPISPPPAGSTGRAAHRAAAPRRLGHALPHPAHPRARHGPPARLGLRGPAPGRDPRPPRLHDGDPPQRDQRRRRPRHRPLRDARHALDLLLSSF